jgi:DNA-binding CsgD family transcriptional regulator
MRIIEIILDSIVYGLGFSMTAVSVVLALHFRRRHLAAFARVLAVLLFVNLDYLTQRLLEILNQSTPIPHLDITVAFLVWLFTVLMLLLAYAVAGFFKTLRPTFPPPVFFRVLLAVCAVYTAATVAVQAGLQAPVWTAGLEFVRKCLVIGVGIAVLTLSLLVRPRLPHGTHRTFTLWFIPLAILNIVFYLPLLFIDTSGLPAVNLSPYFPNSTIGYLLFLIIAARFLAQSYTEQKREARSGPAAAPVGLDAALAGCDLSKRELEVADLLVRGYTNQMIGDALFISLATVKTHVHRIFDKTDVTNRTALAALVARRGYSPLEPDGAAPPLNQERL